MKCVRTRLELEVAGLEECVPRVFSRVPDVEELRMLEFDPDVFFWPDLIREAEQIGNFELARTVRIMLGQELHWPRAASRATRAARRKIWRRLKKLWGASGGSQTR
jgi:hypothetical protein